MRGEIDWATCAYCSGEYQKIKNDVNMHCGTCRLNSHHRVERERDEAVTELKSVREESAAAQSVLEAMVIMLTPPNYVMPAPGAALGLPGEGPASLDALIDPAMPPFKP